MIYRIKPIIKYIILFTIFYYITKYLFDSFNELEHIDLHFDILRLMLSIFLYILYFILGIIIWHLITMQNDCNLSFLNSFIIWTYSSLGKYLPGKLFVLAGRLNFYEKLNRSKKKLHFVSILKLFPHY